MAEANSLELLLREDPLEKFYKQMSAIHDRHAEERARFVNVKAAFQALKNKDPDAIKAYRELDIDTEEGAVEAARILGVSAEEFRAWLDLSGRVADEVIETMDIPQRRKEWEALLPDSPIREITLLDFPPETERPFIVFYSADWCMPCQLAKPTFARLSRFFTKAKLFYSTDDSLKEIYGVEYIPQLVAYSAKGGIIHSSCGGSARELWEEMNLLIDLGASFEGAGTLVCTEAECRIEPKA